VERTISALGAGKLLRLFLDQLRLPVLSRVEDVQDMNLSIIEIVDGNMAVPAGFPSDDDVVQIGTRADRLAPGVAVGQVGDAFFEIPEIRVGMGYAVTFSVPPPNAIEFINRRRGANNRQPGFSRSHSALRFASSASACSAV